MPEAILTGTETASALPKQGELPVFNTLWIGDRLSPLHILCLLSAVRQGHHVRLFGYRRFPELPGEIEQADARMILPESEVVFHGATGSPSLFSNRFRYELIAAGHGAWIDTDQLVLKPIRAADGFIAGWDNPPNKVNVSVLLFPRDSALSDEVVWWSRRRDCVPPWMPWPTRLRQRARRAVGLSGSVADLPWGTMGPLLFDHLCRKHGHTDRVSPMARFSPVPYAEKGLPFRSDGDPEAYFTDETEGVHLYHQGLRGGTDGRNEFANRQLPFEKGSYLWRMAGKLGLSTSLEWSL